MLPRSVLYHPVVLHVLDLVQGKNVTSHYVGYRNWITKIKRLIGLEF